MKRRRQALASPLNHETGLEEEGESVEQETTAAAWAGSLHRRVAHGGGVCIERHCGTTSHVQGGACERRRPLQRQGVQREPAGRPEACVEAAEGSVPGGGVSLGG